MSETVIATENLTKIFADFWHRGKLRAVDGLELSVSAGEVYGLLGPNGSGKSTIMKLILGLLYPTSGELTVFGGSPHKSAIRRRIGYLPEESQLYRHLTARETLHFYGALFGLSRTEVRERTEQLLEMTGLIRAAERPVGKYSKGMLRRIGLAQALINDPDLLVLDEPTAGLDPAGCRQVKDLLLELARRGKTVLVSSHLLADMADVCSRIILLHNGRRLAEGRLADLLEDEHGIRFTFRDVAPSRMRELEKCLAKAGDIQVEVDRPRQSLEQFFIDTVASAGEMERPGGGGVSQTTELAPFIRKS